MTPRIRILTALFALLIVSEYAFATGGLFVRPLNSQQTFELINIKTYDATATIQDQIATTHIDEVFFNNTNNVVEATFIFPLPEGAVITELIYHFNGKKYLASLREKQAAIQAYNEKIRQRIDPALLQDMGENVFKLQIAPINPKSDVRFEISYAEILPYQFGYTEYKFFLNTTGLSPIPLERVSLKVNAKTATNFLNFSSPSHGNTAENSIVQVSPQEYNITYGDEKFIPKKDYLLRFENSRDAVTMTAITYVPVPADSMGSDKFFAMLIVPPDNTTNSNVPKNIIFSADISSSMEGQQLDDLKKSMHAFINGLNPDDRFNIVPFSTNPVAFRKELVIASNENREAARKFVDQLGAAGLTNIEELMKSVLRMQFDSTAANILVFISDGFPSWGERDDQKLLAAIGALNTQKIRIFPFGIGDTVNKKLLQPMGEQNGGFASYLKRTDSIGVIVNGYFQRISRPVLQNLNISYDKLNVYDMFPRPLPDLFFGSQVMQFGRYRNGGSYPVKLSGNMQKDSFSLSKDVNFPEEAGGNKAVARLWAKRKIDYLLGQIALYGEQPELKKAVIDLSIRYGILTVYTALYADPEDPNTTGVEQGLADNGFVVGSSYPNPFASATRINFTVPDFADGQQLVVRVYDMFGRVVRVLFEGSISAGPHEFAWDGRDESGALLPDGVYVYRMEVAGNIMSSTVVIAR